MPANATLSLPRAGKLPSLLSTVSGASMAAGMAIMTGQGVQAAANGLLYPIICADCAAVGNSNTAIIAKTTDATNPIGRRGAAVSPIDGSLYFFQTRTNSKLRKVSQSGSLGKEIDLGSGAIDANGQIVVLPKTGNVVVAARNSSARFGVYSPNLDTLRAYATYDGTNGGRGPWIIPQAKGGFAIVHFDSTTLNIRMAYYDDTGTQLVAPFTVKTLAASADSEPRGIELLNGNITVAFINGGGTDAGFWSAVYGPAGAVVTAAAKLTADSATNYGTGGYRIAAAGNIVAASISGINKLFVIAANGSLVASNGQTGYSTGPYAVTSDGTTFMVLAGTGTATITVSKFDTTGTEKSVLAGSDFYTALTNLDLHAMGDGLASAIVFDSTAGAVLFQTFDFQTGRVVAKLQFTVSTGTATSYGSSVYLGDMGVFATWTDGTTILAAWKMYDTAIQGVALDDAGGAGNVVTFDPSLKGMKFNVPVRGSGSIKFDHSATNQNGRKGSVSPGGLVLTA